MLEDLNRLEEETGLNSDGEATDDSTEKINRRTWWKRGLLAGAALSAGVAVYPFLEAKWCRVLRRTVPVRNLPGPWIGTTLAFLSDTHHGPYVPLAYLRAVVDMTNAQRPDLVVLGGDFCHHGSKYVRPGIEVLGGLRAPLGVFGVLGNHDYWDGERETRDTMARVGIRALTNEGLWRIRGGSRVWLGGVDDLWCGWPDVSAAVGDATEHDAVILASHNPDVAETMTDGRVGLMLSGHTHGGQVVVPGYGAPIVPSRYGQKYVRGYVQGPKAPVFITRGVGTVSPPVRLLCQPEVALLTLVSAD